MATKATTARSRTNGRSTHTKVVPMTPLAPIELTDDMPDEFSEREPLFSLHGVVYDIPIRVPVADTLVYAEVFMERGIDAAIIWAMKHALGDTGYTALKGHRALTSDQLNQIVAVVRGKFDGSDPKGRRRNA